MKSINKVFVALWFVVGIFLLGFLGLMTASFTTQTTEFAGRADLKLSFENSAHQRMAVLLTDENDQPLAPGANGSLLLHPQFESRESNIFDKLLGGPRPLAAVIVFYESGHKRHEITFTYNRHEQVWKSELSFPDPTIAKVELENSTLVFRGFEGGRRLYESSIEAKALVGPVDL